MFNIDPIDLLKWLKSKDRRDFEDVALIVADYIVEQRAPDEVFREIVDLIIEVPEERGLRLVR